MALDYFLLVFIAAFGVIQIASAYAHYRGLSLYTNTVLQYFFGSILIIAAFCWFFLSEDRNFQHTVEGTQQLGLFLMAIISSYLFTAITASLVHLIARYGTGSAQRKSDRKGFEELKRRTLFKSIFHDRLGRED
jgi:uncharacterized membrane protein